MSPDEFQRIKLDLSSFADDENELIYDEQGSFMFNRFGRPVEIQVYTNADDTLFVRFNSEDVPYKTFIAKEMAHLDLFANKLIQKAVPPEGDDYVDPMATKLTAIGSQPGMALKLLKKECEEQALIGSKISFVTADAGHGKSMLLRHFQQKQAEEYINGKSKFLFWHIDLHGRDLVRLNEAIMYEIGELRLSGIYYSTVLTLLRRHLLVLGIDGFDELAAEKGGDTALNSISSLVLNMDGKGVLIAASRRTFFDTQDFLKRSGILKNNIGNGCSFNEVKINNWTANQCKQFLANYAFDDEEYDKLVDSLRTAEHPLLERPFLFTKLVKNSFNDGISPSEFISKDVGHLESINDVIFAFIKREVDKWTHYDKETGKPYLTLGQHMELLSEIASEMWKAQNDVLSDDSIQLILSIFLDEWNIEQTLRSQVTRMVSTHAMLIPVEGKDGYKKFDHEEFLYFFLARSMEGITRRCVKSGNFKPLHTLLSQSQLPDSVAHYFSTLLDGIRVEDIVNGLMTEVGKEWKATGLQPNVGTILPYILDRYVHSNEIKIQGGVVFSSLVFENKRISNVVFCGCTFMNISFKNTELSNVRFEKCQFNGIKIVDESNNSFENVSIDSASQVSRVSFIYNQDEDYEFTEYAPNVIRQILQGIGIIIDSMGSDNVRNNDVVAERHDMEFYKAIKRLLNKYIRSNCLYESDIKTLKFLNYSNPDMVMTEIIPLLEKYDIVERRDNKRTRQAGTYGWALSKYDISEILLAEENKESALYKFWQEVKNR